MTSRIGAAVGARARREPTRSVHLRPVRALLSWSDVVERLAVQHGPAGRDPLPLGNKPDPYDELVYILLTVMTRSQPRIDRAYDGLVRLRGDEGWSGLLDADPDELRDVLEPLGFVNRRTDQLLRLVADVEDRFGGTLADLAEVSDDDAMAALTSLPGVGAKTAKCVLLYALGRAVLPVDIHVLRVAKRLGLVDEAATWADADRQLELEVPPDLKFDVHVQLVIHGRAVCRSPNPQCDDCALLDGCPTGALAPRLRSDYVRR